MVSQLNRNIKRREYQKTIYKGGPLTIDRLCKDCNQICPCRKSGVSSGGTIQYRTRCIDCYKIWENIYKFTTRKSKTLTAKNKRMRDAKQRCVSYKGGKCETCGYSKSLRALTFHHIDRADKKYDITRIKDHNWEKVKLELNKCELICFNCHMEREEYYESNK